MSSAIRAVALVDGSDRAAAFDAIGDAVWAVTIVDAGLVRYHPGAYDDLLAAEAPTGRQVIEQVLGGMRFVRNRIAGDAAVADLVEPAAGDPVARGVVLDWKWKPVAQPAVTSRASRTRAWETARYQAYQAGVAGHSVAETFARAEAFLLQAAASEALITDAVVPTAPPVAVALRKRRMRR